MITSYGQLKSEKKRVKREIRKLNIERAINSISSDQEVVSFAGLLIGSTIVPTEPASGVILIGVSTFSMLECAKLGYDMYYAKSLLNTKKEELKTLQDNINIHKEIYKERKKNLKSFF